MADVFSKNKRSEVMRQVKSKFNKSTELQLIKIFKNNHIKGWRRNQNIFGHPDFTFNKYKIVIFVDGCFWHGHNCRNTKPKDNKEYWEDKIKKNKKRDRKVNLVLKNNNWQVIRIWECQLKNTFFQKKIKKLKATIAINPSPTSATADPTELAHHDI